MASRKLSDAHPELIESFDWIKFRFEEAFPGFELRPTCTYRSPVEQAIEFAAGRSRLDGTRRKSKHNHKPSDAIDVGIFDPAGRYLTGDGDLSRALYWIVGLLAQKRGLRFGGDWDGDGILVLPDPSESLNDPFHLERVA